MTPRPRREQSACLLHVFVDVEVHVPVAQECPRPLHEFLRTRRGLFRTRGWPRNARQRRSLRAPAPEGRTGTAGVQWS
jgi:hypothetical protein